MSLKEFKDKINAEVFFVESFADNDVVWLREGEGKAANFVNLLKVSFVLCKMETMADRLKIIIKKADYDPEALKRLLTRFHNEVLQEWVNSHCGHPSDKYDQIVAIRRQFEKFATGETINDVHNFAIYIPFENKIYGFKAIENQFLMVDSVIYKNIEKFL